MSGINVFIASAEKEIYRGKANMLIASTSNGEIAVLPGHAPLLAILRPGEIRILCESENHTSNCAPMDIIVHGGFLEVQPESVTILADAVERAEDINAAQAKKALEQAKKQMLSSDKNIASKALLDLELAIAKLQLLRRKSKQSLLKP